MDGPTLVVDGACGGLAAWTRRQDVRKDTLAVPGVLLWLLPVGWHNSLP